MLLGSCLCASARFPSFPDVGAPPCWPAAASYSLSPANSHSCYQSVNPYRKLSAGQDERKTQSEDSTYDQSGLKGMHR